MEQATQVTIAEAVKQVGAALAEAAKEYGPDAVDLALMAYRVDAAQQLVLGTLMAALVLAVVKAYLLFWAWSGKQIEVVGPVNDEGYFVGRLAFGLAGAGAVVLLSASAIYRLLDLSAWAASFGYPELRIAMKALQAAGLM
ncbi:MAG: hypothetical protein RLZ51_1882 [Pseudomonadota bacterium]|jgi:hypothetical protein